MKRIFLGSFRISVGVYNETRFVVCAAWKDKIFYGNYPRPGFVWETLKARVRFLASFLQVWPVYFEVFSRDCDLCESTRLVKAPCFFIGYRELRRAAEDWTEGPFHFHQLTRAEAKAFRPHWRDRIGEAFDDGKGTQVIL